MSPFHEVPAPVVLDLLFDGVYQVDADRRIQKWNKAAEALTGFSEAEVIGRSCGDGLLVHVDASGKCLCDSDCPLKRSMESDITCEEQVYLRHKLGYRVPVEIRTVATKDLGTDIVHGIEIFRESPYAADLAEHLAELNALALVDPLTGLYNRRYLDAELSKLVANTQRDPTPFAVLILDLDEFKQVNDTHGHLQGDAVLTAVAATLRGAVRDFDTVGRWGGEEFMMLLPHSNREQAQTCAERCRALVECTQVPLNGSFIQITASVGCAVYHKGMKEADIVATADTELYRCKRDGKNSVSTFG